MRALVLLFALCSFAHAEDDPDVAAARRHFVKAKAQLEKGNYQAALKEFMVARQIKPLPDLDYDVARCLDALERYPEAIAEYQKYLAHAPPDAADVQKRVQTLKDRMAAIAHIDEPAVEKAPPPEKPAEPPPPPPAPPVEKVVEKPMPSVVESEPEPIPVRRARIDKPLYKRWWLWTAVGGAAVVVAVGVGLGVGLSASNAPEFQPSLQPFGPGAR